MLSAVFKSVYRTLMHQKRYAAINILGLALGVSVFLVMALIVHYEGSYDVSLPHAEQIYQVDEISNVPQQAVEESSYVSFVPFPFLKQDFPEIKAAVYAMQIPLTVRSGEEIGQEKVTLTDKDFFSVFDLNLLVGDKNTALDGPGKVVISQDMARKYFGTTNALGKTVRIDNGKTDAVVSGVLATPPANRTMSFDFIELTPTAWFSQMAFTNWGSGWGTLWVRLVHPQDQARVDEGLKHYVPRHPGNWTAGMIKESFGDGNLELIPLPKVHFHNAAIGEGGNSQSLVHILGLIGCAALATAVINYVNLATSRSVLRAREVAMRKVLGATRGALVLQFMCEALVLVLIAVAISAAMTEMALHWVNAWGGWALWMDWPFILPMLAVVVLVTTIIAGFYPAIVLSGYRPSLVLASSKTPSGGRLESAVRSALVVGQFGFALVLGICTMVMLSQASYIEHMDQGLPRDGLIVIHSLINQDLKPRQKEIITRLAAVPGVTVATRTDIYPHNLVNNMDWVLTGHVDKHNMGYGSATIGYFEALNAHLLAGRFFDTQHGMDYSVTTPDSQAAEWNVIISRRAAKDFGFSTPEQAIGASIHSVFNGTNGHMHHIIGVVEDIQFRSAQSRMPAVVYFGTNDPLDYAGAIIRYNHTPQNVMMDRLKAAWREVAPDAGFSAESVADIFAADAAPDRNRGNLFAIGASVAIGIACLGLYGLSSFYVFRRQQEIGIRKVLGASQKDIIHKLMFDFLKPIFIATLIAWPISLVLMGEWLSLFSNRINLSFRPFVEITFLTFLIAILTIFVQVFRAARQTPSEILSVDR
ncbi:transmembrane transport protein [Neokomagataea thailandica NBRC 106555]|uniref:FtsX-like permease family protein n=2 Tax=Neokomagataea TaxID=1223423 RepID=A0A4Y6V7Z2_9PROT|nr:MULTISPECIES: ABC transporter permease [Neokomagataea]QDH25454.1 FtsX-like permease family protein [Neokomagataea tanensis]GBR50764.1 transmembrane transport protein [Neokomagataea thailandica NBRC 106555]